MDFGLLLETQQVLNIFRLMPGDILPIKEDFFVYSDNAKLATFSSADKAADIYVWNCA
ncbi:hypothetical protein XNW1_480035 [Xenorhabdus nematophila str. Websteri]|nr:hypothetical protein XNA1_4650014 [Xenorhabdus nematophila str. Anatoliense]CEE95735.1 hypothetical protein XNA1_630013 [Xenorhabdus nematophila str. Anatoliense]CEF33371.1 hypothetical protein XNW1_4730034 [Xenorhabdus nematophila str. Websteri]CEF33523.1 hypothetical protein XNW1_480035 [Xenorhabdus nematophila str. Websteri]